MLNLTIKEATSLLNAYGLECHWHQVKKWAVEGKIKAIHEDRVYRIEEKEVHKFIEASWVGNGYEVGIDNETKISKLLDQIDDLVQRVEQLEYEKEELQLELAKYREIPN
ncbi:hypothetical protein P9265_06645 [Schinkia azotoformans]|uniref:hypothetical protein n=1 Tax=Schinkia azotoformans TaxID=1454 RepID=UPI002E1E8869|nr:hypothetical protein [Schinkia azotoformans]